MSSLIRKIARKVVADEMPRQGGFPGASNSFPTWVTAFDDVPAQPPRRLIEVALDATRAALNDVSLDDLAKRPNCPDYFTIWPGEHYKLLAGLLLVLKPKVVIEIGTDTGLSAVTIKKFLPPGGKVVTFDLRPWKTVDESVLTDADFADGQLEQRLVDLADPKNFEANRSLLEQAEFFFVDGPKNIEYETALMAQLATIKYTTPPIMLWDDTRLAGMVKYWRELKHPTLDLTSFGHWSGTGLLELK
ncbi:MAG TPA: hypothetical protein VEA69_13525 [Tepidisphaeraceae bacterium]|nr:hypothetical protein [Tepidisphaeraceae bacterium]